MLRRLQRSASQPAGSENNPKAMKEAVDERDQLGIGAAVGHFELDHDGRKDQDDEVIQRVRPLRNPIASRRREELPAPEE